ncbi:MAG TPA: right-handed parallel beta-helix repeat-containing protein [Burkholderiales bacterium]|nr:right-handed parallel beta-helix repeat-containing protein [Burkholderiales bacterium]
MKKLIAILAFSFCCQAQAANYYFSDCKAGAAPGCVIGNDASLTPTNPATPYRSATKAFEVFRIAAAGDQILFAKGGSFKVNGENLLQNLNATAGNPIIMSSYQPSWYLGSAKPILNQAGNYPLLVFSDGGGAEADGGYVVRNLHLRGGTPAGGGHWGIFINQLASDVRLNNLTIDNFHIGVYCGNDGRRVTLKNSTLTNNRGTGILWGCHESVVENNIFDNNGYGHEFLDHQMYLTSHPDGTNGMTVRGNKLTNSVHYNGTRCTGAPIVGHGSISDLLIENNEIIETTPALDGCWGIAIDGGYFPEEGVERFSNVTIRGNLLVNVGNTGISCTSCDGWTIENNVLVWETLSNAYGIAVPSNDLGAATKQGDHPTTQVAIRNNTIYYKLAGPGAIGIKTAEQGTFTVSSNLIVFNSTSHTSAQCFDTTNRSIANFDGFSSNLCNNKSGPAKFSQTYATHAAALSANPLWNIGGISDKPYFAQAPSALNGYSLNVLSSSPVINAGDAATCSTTSYGGAVRSSHCDIGAYEYVAP